jgi:hypothetical protein
MNRTIASLICGSVLASKGDIEELLFEPGVIVSYESIRRWCGKFGAGSARRVKAVRRKPGTTWHLDEVFVTLRGKPYPKETLIRMGIAIVLHYYPDVEYKTMPNGSGQRGRDCAANRSVSLGDDAAPTSVRDSQSRRISAPGILRPPNALPPGRFPTP